MNQFPLKTLMIGGVGLGQSFFETSMPVLQWFIALGTLVIIIITIVKKLKNGTNAK